MPGDQIMQSRDLNRQRGAVLLVCMIVLLMLTLIGLSGARGVILQEKMTFASKDAQLALQVAETSVRAAEAEIEALVLPEAGFDGSGHLHPGGNAPADLLAESTWDNAAELDALLTMGGKDFDGQYIIERAGQLEDTPTDQGGGYGQGGATSQPSAHVYRIVARGRGLAGTERIIVTHYGKRF